MTDASLDATDADETPVVPVPGTCAAPFPLAADSRAREVTGDTSKTPKRATGHSCHAGPSREVVYALDHPGGDLWLDTYGSSYATVLALRTSCEDARTERACSTRTTAYAPAASRILYRALERGRYYVILDAEEPDGGGPYRLGYRAEATPARWSCDATPATAISDIEVAGKRVALGVDVYDTIAGRSDVSLRPGFFGERSCPDVTGERAVGRGAEQVYRLDLRATRIVKIMVDAIPPSIFTSRDPPFSLLAYVRSGQAPPEVDAVTNCRRSSGDPGDTCVPFDTATELHAGVQWLVIDSIEGSRGRYHARIYVY